MKGNKLLDLNDALFEQIQTIVEEEEITETQFKKAKMISDLGKVIVQNAKVMLEGEKYLSDYGKTPSDREDLKKGGISQVLQIQTDLKTNNNLGVKNGNK